MNDLMLDLETMGMTAGSAILSIGAVFFDMKARALGPEFYRIIDLEDACAHGLTIAPATVLWWMKQSDEARELFKQPGEGLAHTLSYFGSWANANCPREDMKVWGCGVDFDNVLISAAYKACGLELPWRWFNNRDYRTVKNQYRDVKIDRSGGVHHNALDDAKAQALHLIRILNPVIVSAEAKSIAELNSLSSATVGNVTAKHDELVTRGNSNFAAAMAGDLSGNPAPTGDPPTQA